MTTHDNLDSTTARIVRAVLCVFIVVVAVAITPFTEDPTNVVKRLIVQWFAFLSFGVLAAGNAIERRPFVWPRIGFRILLVFTALNVVAALASDYPANSIESAKTFIALAALYFTAANAVRNERQLRPILWAVCLGVALGSAYAFIQKAGLDPFPWEDKAGDTYTHLPGAFGNPNIAGHALVIAIISACYLASKPRARWAAVFAVLFLTHLYFTGYRAGPVALAAAGVAVILTLPRLARAMPTDVPPMPAPAKAGVIPAKAGTLGYLRALDFLQRLPMFTRVVLLAVTVFALLGLAALSISTGRPYPLDSSLLLRYNGWSNAARMITERPLLGYGPGNFVIETPRFWTPFEQEWYEDRLLMNEYAHNELLEAALGAGLIATGIYILWFARGFAAAIAARRETNSGRIAIFFAAILTAFFVDGLFGFPFHAPVSAAYFAVIVGAFEGVLAPSKIIFRRSGAIAAASGALLLATALLESRSFISEVFFQRGLLYEAVNRPDHAEDLYARGERLAPYDWRFGRRRGLLAYSEGKWADAITHFERSLDLSPNWVSTLVPLANSYLKQADAGEVSRKMTALSRASEYATRAVSLDHDSTASREIVARAAFVRATEAAATAPDAGEMTSNAWKEAREALENALRMPLESPGPFHEMLAETLLKFEGGSAKQLLAAACRTYPGEEAYWGRLYRYVLDQGEFDFMLAEIDRALPRIEGTTFRGRKTRAMLRVWQGIILERAPADLDAAQAAYVAAVMEAPNQLRSWQAFSAFATRHERFAALVEAFRDAFATTSPEDELAPPLEAVRLAWIERPPMLSEAAKTLTGPAERFGAAASNEYGWAADVVLREVQVPGVDAAERAETFYYLGRVYKALGSYDVAVRLLSAATGSLDPEQQSESTFVLAESLIAAGQARDGLALLDTIASQYEKTFRFQIGRARALAGAGESDAAREALRRLLRSSGLSAEERREAEAELVSVGKPAARE